MGRHVVALDGLRGVAVAAVVGYHLRPDLVPGGYLGVDLFFVLSGYLITSLLLDERRDTGSVDLTAFAGRRLRRLLPAVLVLVVVVVAHEWRWGDLGQLTQVRRHALATLGYVANWVFIADGDSYFSEVAGPPLLRHVWSLAIEEQFYLLWPVTVLVVGRRWGRRGVGGAATLAAVASVVAMALLFDPGEPSRAYFGTDTRIFEPLVGAIGAVLLPLHAEKPRWVHRAGVAGAGVWLTAVFVVDDAWTGFYRGGAALLAVASLAWIWAASSGAGGARLLRARPVAGLGVISYGVYLWHWPLLVMLRRAHGSGGAVDLAVLGATLLVASASYVAVERPIRRGRRFAGLVGRGMRPLGAAVAAVVLVAGFAVVATRGAVPAEAVTVDDEIEALVAAPAPLAAPQGGRQGTGEQGAAGSVDRGAATAPVTVALIGDSSAWTLGGGLVSWGTHHGPYTSPFDPDRIRLLNLARKGYRLVPGATTDLGGVRERPPDDSEDEEWWRATIAEVRPDLVVAMFGLHDLQGREVAGARVEFGSAEFDELATGAARDLLSDLAAIAPVVVLTSPPLVGADMPQPEMAAFFDTASAGRSAHLNDLLRQVAAGDERIQVVDYAAWLCPGENATQVVRDGCRLTADGAPARHDGVHYTAAGARLAAAWLTAPLLEAAASDRAL